MAESIVMSQRDRAEFTSKAIKELTELSCELQQRVGQLEELLDRANQERDVLKERVKELTDPPRHNFCGRKDHCADCDCFGRL